MRYEINNVFFREVLEETLSDKLGGRKNTSCYIQVDSPVIDIKIVAYGVSQSKFVKLINGDFFFQLWIGETGHFQELSIILWDDTLISFDQQYIPCEPIYGLPLVRIDPENNFAYNDLFCKKLHLNFNESSFQISWVESIDSVFWYQFSNIFFAFNKQGVFCKILYIFHDLNEKDAILKEMHEKIRRFNFQPKT